MCFLFITLDNITPPALTPTVESLVTQCNVSVPQMSECTNMTPAFTQSATGKQTHSECVVSHVQSTNDGVGGWSHTDRRRVKGWRGYSHTHLLSV